MILSLAVIALLHSPCATGLASWYGPKFYGRKTASGEVLQRHGFTAAHKTLPFGTMVQVRNPVNGKFILVEVTDRGPFVKGRIIDLSKDAAEAIGLNGVGKVSIE